MRTPKTKNANVQPKVRSLKIQPQIRFNTLSHTTFPEIRLRGNWLGKLGFAPDRRVSITTMDKLLIVRLDE
jgi:hypothetical protein